MSMGPGLVRCAKINWFVLARCAKINWFVVFGFVVGILLAASSRAT